MAETPSFNVAKVGYISGTGGDSLDGFIFEGEFEINEMFYINGEFANIGESGIDVKALAIGLGYKKDISPNATLFGEFNYINVEIDASFGEIGNFDFSDDGYELKLGVKSMLSNNFQLSGALVYADLTDSNTLLELGAVYEFTENFGAYADIETDFDDDTYAVGIRFTF